MQVQIVQGLYGRPFLHLIPEYDKLQQVKLGSNVG